MSHFTVMIIGDSPEEQLAPFNEHIEMDEYEKEPVSEIDKQRFIKCYTKAQEGRSYGVQSESKAEANAKLSFDDLYDEFKHDWNTGSWKKNKDGIFVEVSTYNPKSKWDWYQLGGRWSRMLKLKKDAKGINGSPSFSTKEQIPKEGYADSALLKDIDFEGMIKEAEKEARKRYNKVLNLCEGEIPTVEVLWDELFDEEGKHKDLDNKRDFYFDQPSIKYFNEKCAGKKVRYNLEEFQISKKEYITDAAKTALSISVFSLLKNGTWYEKGKIGWFASVSDAKKTSDWSDEIIQHLKEVDGNTLISIYDCHI